MEEKRHPFTFNTQASIELSDHEDLMNMMVDAGFDVVFVGIETPHEESLTECCEIQNKTRDLLASIRNIQRSGLEVQGGFIVGFDQDPVTSIRHPDQVHPGQRGTVMAMVGILIALPRTHSFTKG